MSGASKLKFVIIAGGPCSGKTSVVSRLAEWLRSEGYSVYVIRDWAREIIRREKPKGDKGILPWTDRARFEREVIKSYLSEYSKIFENPTRTYDIVFDDGSAFSAGAYCRVDNVEIPLEYTSLLKYVDKVSLVLLMDFPRKYRRDQERWEDREYAIRIHREIIRLHNELFHGRTVMIEYMESIDKKVETAYRIIKEKLLS